MDYVYDIVLNFQNNYYEFYEWKSSDKIINVKKVPIYKISTKDYLNIKEHSITIDKISLPKQSKLFLVTNGFEIMGLLINNKGQIIKKSSLIFEESDDILSDIEDIKSINIKYQIDNFHKQQLMSRANEEKMQYIDNCLKNIDKQKDEYFLKYLYYDIYDTKEDDIDKIYQDLIKLANNDIPKMYYYLKRVNLELNKQ
jgi:hypothetical protein